MSQHELLEQHYQNSAGQEAVAAIAVQEGAEVTGSTLTEAETRAFEAIVEAEERADFEGIIDEIDKEVTPEMEKDLKITMSAKQWGLNNQVITKL